MMTTCVLCDAWFSAAESNADPAYSQLCRACARDVILPVDWVDIDTPEGVAILKRQPMVPDEFDDDETCDYREEDVVT